MIIWTIQLAHVWEMLQRDGILYGPETVDDSIQWRTAYDWMVEQMERRLGPRPKPGAYPLWAWYQWDGAARRKSGLRRAAHVPGKTRAVRIEFEIAEDQILLSDFQAWHVPLNYGHLALNEAEYEAFEAELAQRGLAWEPGQHLADPAYHARILKSWERIFDIDQVDPDGWWTCTTLAEKDIQGTFWSLSLAQVRKVTPFIGRGKAL
ncbi:MAG TPA: DUF3841 domain-containing protein [Ktedonobacterales bacterium]|nr:DUF3841 domain-containing protein [Ktedonobacterales bacterium]